MRGFQGDGPRRHRHHRRLRQALRRLRLRRGRPRLQHGRLLRAHAAQRRPAAVPGRGRRRGRHPDERVQRDRRHAGHRQRPSAARPSSRASGASTASWSPTGARSASWCRTASPPTSAAPRSSPSTAGSDMDMESERLRRASRRAGRVGRGRRGADRRRGAARPARQVRSSASSTIPTATRTRSARRASCSATRCTRRLADVARKSIVLLKNDGRHAAARQGRRHDRRDRTAGRRQGHSARQLARPGGHRFGGVAAGRHPGRGLRRRHRAPRPGSAADGRRALVHPRADDQRGRIAPASPRPWRRPASADTVVLALGEDGVPERRGSQPGRHRAQGRPGGSAARGAGGQRQRRRGADERPAAGPLRRGRSGARHRRGLAPGLAGRPRHRRRAVRRLQPVGQAAGLLPAPRRPGAALLQRQEHRPAGADGHGLLVALHATRPTARCSRSGTA